MSDPYAQPAPEGYGAQQPNYPVDPAAQQYTGQAPTWDANAYAQQPTQQYPSGAFVPQAAPASPYPFRFAEGEELVGTFPLAQKKRPMGTLVSYLFVTSQRVIYAAEAKTVFASSTELKQHQLDDVTGIETSRRRGLGAMGGALVISMFLALIFLIISASIAGSIASNPLIAYSGASSFFSGGVVMMILAIVALVALDVMVIWSLLRPTSALKIVTKSWAARTGVQIDWLFAVVAILVVLFLGPLIGLGLLIWYGLRSLGLFRAADAPLYTASANLDAAAFEANTLITELQNR